MHLARTKDRKEANYLVIGWKNSALSQLLFAAMMAAAGAAVCAGSSAAGAPDYHTYVIEETPEETTPDEIEATAEA